MRSDLLPLIDLLATPPSATWLDAVSSALQTDHVIMLACIATLLAVLAAMAEVGRDGRLSAPWFPSPLTLNLFTATSLLLLGISLTTASHPSWLLILTPIVVNAVGYFACLAFVRHTTIVRSRPAIASRYEESRSNHEVNTPTA